MHILENVHHITLFMRNVESGFIVLDAKSNVVFSTDPANQLFGEVLEGQPLSKFIHDDNPENPHNGFYTAEPGAVDQDRHVNALINGEKVPVLIELRTGWHFNGDFYMGGFVRRIDS